MSVSDRSDYYSYLCRMLSFRPSTFAPLPPLLLHSLSRSGIPTSTALLASTVHSGFEELRLKIEVHRPTPTPRNISQFNTCIEQYSIPTKPRRVYRDHREPSTYERVLFSAVVCLIMILLYR